MKGIREMTAGRIVASCVALMLGASPLAAAERYRVLAYTIAPGDLGHPSTATAQKVMPQWGKKRGITIDFATEPSVFNAKNLSRYKAVVFVSVEGQKLSGDQRKAFEDYIRRGGGFVGIHAAAGLAREAEWPFYYGLLGRVQFVAHTPSYIWSTPPLAPGQVPTGKTPVTFRGPLDQAPPDADPGEFWHMPGAAAISWTPGRLVVEDTRSEAMKTLRTGVRVEEWYGFDDNPRSRVHVLASVDENSYVPVGSSMGADHPIAWCHEYQGGRAVYTALGHRRETWADDAGFEGHVMGAIEMAAGAAPFNCKVNNPPPPAAPRIWRFHAVSPSTPADGGSHSASPSRDR